MVDTGEMRDKNGKSKVDRQTRGSSQKQPLLYKRMYSQKGYTEKGYYIVKKTVVASSSPGNMMALDLR